MCCLDTPLSVLYRQETMKRQDHLTMFRDSVWNSNRPKIHVVPNPDCVKYTHRLPSTCRRIMRPLKRVPICFPSVVMRSTFLPSDARRYKWSTHFTPVDAPLCPKLDNHLFFSPPLMFSRCQRRQPSSATQTYLSGFEVPSSVPTRCCCTKWTPGVRRQTHVA